MCGIVGIISQTKRDLVSDAIQSLSDLEYRGYDSAGLAIRTNGGITVHKCMGAPSINLHPEDVLEKLHAPSEGIQSLIGHNRWSTHGAPSLKNAHPHLDCKKKVAIVHNGTILNYEPLKKSLMQRGHTFHSDTDTEVIAHAIEETSKHEKNFEKAFVQALTMLEGSFAVLAMHVDEPEKLYAAKNGSPLNIGITHDSFVVASSTNPLVRYTSTFITLADKEYAVLKAQKNNLTHHIFRFRGGTVESVKKKPKLLEEIDIDSIGKGTYETHMLKEVFEQSSTTQTTMLGRTDAQKGDVVFGGLFDHEDYLASIDNILIVGSGTAHHAGLFGKEIIERLTNINVQCDISSEFKYRKHNLPTENTLVLAVSQSGETADTLNAIAEARKKRYKVCGIVNAVGSAMTSATDFGIYTRVGPEIGVASTKAFTGQLTVMYLFALHLARQRAMTAGEGSAWVADLDTLPDHMNTALTLAAAVEKLAKKYSGMKTVNFIGRGMHVPIAHEASLKFKELTYIESGSYPMGELKHGPIAVIDEDSLSIVIMPRDDLFDISKNSVEQIKAKGGRVIVLTDTSAHKDAIVKHADDVIFLPKVTNSLLYPLIEIIPLQLFAYYFAQTLGRDIDRPRNLAKSVTVE